jgi:hypothetical protein
MPLRGYSSGSYFLGFASKKTLVTREHRNIPAICRSFITELFLNFDSHLIHAFAGKLLINSKDLSLTYIMLGSLLLVLRPSANDVLYRYTWRTTFQNKCQ